MIKTLTYEEAKRLREQVQERFRQSPGNGAGVKITSYKDGYKPLAEHIAQEVPGSEASVSVTRLRKFFYDTNPDLRPPDKLDQPSFGDDFVRVLRQYVGPDIQPPPPPPPPPSFPWRLLLGVALLLGAALLLLRSQFEAAATGWEEPFDTVHPDSLRARGWEILDYDSAAFAAQNREGHLTLYTLRGDYWYTLPDTPIIVNALVRKIGLSEGKISVKISDFNPTQDWQQAGILLLDRTRDKSHLVRMTCAANGTGPQTGRFFQMLRTEYGTVYDASPPYPISIWQQDDTPPPMPVPAWMQVRFQRNRFRCFVHYWHEYSSYIPIGEFDFDFEPYYVALVAFRGLRDHRRELNRSETIPVCFDYVKVEPLRR